MMWDVAREYTPWAVAGSFMLLLANGRLVTRRVLLDLVALWQKRAEDAADRAAVADKRAEHWEAAFHAEAKTSAVQAEQIGELMESARLTQHIADAIPKRGGHRDG